MTGRSPRHHRRVRGDDGAFLAEAALVVPVLLFLLMGLFDFSLIELRTSQLGSAARDGARAGMVDYIDADLDAYTGGACPAAPAVKASFAKICSAVTARLAGATVNSITVRCYAGLGNTATDQRPCKEAYYEAGGGDPMTMVVTVTTSYRSITYPGQLFFGPAKALTSSARMVIS
jgi:Flp pilus assembly protein TadG